jgi:BTB/POZ domain
MLYTQAESLLSIPGLGCEAHAQDHACPPAIPPLPESIYVNEADLIIQSSDFVEFRIHKSMLAFSSQVFRDMFSLPQPSNEIVDGLPVLRLSEDAELVRALITVLYPIPSELPATYDRVVSLLATAQKYDMPAAQSSIRAEVGHRKLTAQSGDQAFHAFAIASRNNLSPETSTAAHLTLDYSMTLENIGSRLRLFEGWALRSLTIFRRCRRDDMLSCLESFLDGRNGPSKIWFGCPEVTQANSNTRFGVYSSQSLPQWLSKIFTELIAELKQTFTNPLMQPSSLRKKYLAALGSHTVRTGSGFNPAKACEFCFEVHVRQGEEYYTELERNLTLARDKASSAFTL